MWYPYLQVLKAFIKSDMMGDSCNLPIIFYKKNYIGKIETKIWIYVEIEQDWDIII